MRCGLIEKERARIEEACSSWPQKEETCATSYTLFCFDWFKHFQSFLELVHSETPVLSFFFILLFCYNLLLKIFFSTAHHKSIIKNLVKSLITTCGG